MASLNDLAASLREASSKRQVEELYHKALDLHDGAASEALLDLLNKCDRRWFSIHLKAANHPTQPTHHNHP